MKWTISTFNFNSEAIYEEMCQSYGLFRAPPPQPPHSFGKNEKCPKKKTTYELVRQYILNMYVCFLPCTFDLPPTHTQTGKNPMLMQNSFWMASQISDYPIVSKYSNYKKSKYFQEKSEGRQTMEMKA